MFRYRSTIALITLTLAACKVPPGPIESTRPRHVVVLPGICGTRFDLGGTRRFARQVERELPAVSAQVWDWTALEARPSLVGLSNLTDYGRNRRRAARLAQEIEAWRKEHPDTALYLLGLSGGGGMALFVSEELPPAVALEAIVLVSAAVAPDYDLSKALSRATRGIYNYYSAEDEFMLATETSRHGTMDRQFGPSAGHVGLNTHGIRVFQLAWNPSMRELGNSGGHNDGLQSEFARRYLLPLFAEDPSRVPPEWRGGDPVGPQPSNGHSTRR